jgi:hypothetical protein
VGEFFNVAAIEDQRMNAVCRPKWDVTNTAGVLLLDKNRRIGARHASLAQFDEAIEFAEVVGEDNFEAMRAKRDALAPYWHHGVTMEQAVAAYEAAMD